MKSSFLACVLIAGLATAAFAAPAETELKAVVQQMMDAYLKGNLEVIEELTAEESISIDPDGTIFSKAQDLQELGEKKVTFTTARMDEVKVRMMGDNHALVTGIVRSSGKYKGEKFDIAARQVRAFEKQDGKWRTIYSQSTEIGQPAE
jgi:hypothetical protein